MSTPRRGLLVIAAAVMLVALGLSWGATPYVPGTLLPGQFTSRIGLNGELITEFTPGTYLPGIGGADVNGFETAARVSAAAGALLLAVGIRRRSRGLVLAGTGVALLGAFIGLDGGLRAGQLAYLLAVVLAFAGSGVARRDSVGSEV